MCNFEINVNCTSGGIVHTHTIVVKSSTGAYGASHPSRVRLQYTCPVTGDALIAAFEPPNGAARPFSVEKVN